MYFIPFAKVIMKITDSSCFSWIDFREIRSKINRKLKIRLICCACYRNLNLGIISNLTLIKLKNKVYIFSDVKLLFE